MSANNFVKHEICSKLLFSIASIPTSPPGTFYYSQQQCNKTVPANSYEAKSSVSSVCYGSNTVCNLYSKLNGMRIEIQFRQITTDFQWLLVWISKCAMFMQCSVGFVCVLVCVRVLYSIDILSVNVVHWNIDMIWQKSCERYLNRKYSFSSFQQCVTFNCIHNGTQQQQHTKKKQPKN